MWLNFDLWDMILNIPRCKQNFNVFLEKLSDIFNPQRLIPHEANIRLTVITYMTLCLSA